MIRQIFASAYYGLRGVIFQLHLQRLRWRFAKDRTAERLDFDWSATNYNRVSVVNLLLSGRPEGRYLEVGCAGNVTFDAVLAAQKFGVDPASGGTHRMTSDEFFQTWRGEPFDVIFIDGLHHYQQAARDIRNSLDFLAEHGWIVLHDMLPRDWLEEHVPRLSHAWTGDVWKCAFELAASPDVDFRLLAIDYGVGVVQPLVRKARIADLRRELQDQSFAYLCENLGRLPITRYDEGRYWMLEKLRQAVKAGLVSTLAESVRHR